MLNAAFHFIEVVCKKRIIEFMMRAEVAKHALFFLKAKHQRVVHQMPDLLVLGLLISLYELNKQKMYALPSHMVALMLGIDVAVVHDIKFKVIRNFYFLRLFCPSRLILYLLCPICWRISCPNFAPYSAAALILVNQMELDDFLKAAVEG